MKFVKVMQSVNQDGFEALRGGAPPDSGSISCDAVCAQARHRYDEHITGTIRKRMLLRRADNHENKMPVSPAFRRTILGGKTLDDGSCSEAGSPMDMLS